MVQSTKRDQLTEMGVKDLWKVLSPAGQSVPIKSLSGKTLAVDLSGWIVEFRANQNVPHLYLRTLYQRTTRLMKQGLKLVCVADGIAPECKRNAMMTRCKDRPGTPNVNRSRFKFIVEKCFEMLECLGLPCIWAPGEAEAYCAWLNSHGYVDGILTEDSDTFLYGGKVIYKDLKTLNKFEYEVDAYDMENIKEKLELTRETMVAMAMLVGCDYDEEGIRDIGIEKTRELITELKNNHLDPLTRITEWRNNEELQRLSKVEERRTAHCKQCQHRGTKTQHVKEGCTDCSLDVSCDQSSKVKCSCGSVYHKKEKYSQELRCYQKALQNPSFPNETMVNEYLHANDSVQRINFDRRPIDITKLKSQVEWEPHEKIAELVVQLQMTGQSSFLGTESRIRPLKIRKECKQNFVKCFEVEWTKFDTDKQTNGDCYTIIVCQDAFTKLYNNEVEKFRAEMEKEKERKKEDKLVRRGEKRKQVDSEQPKIKDFFKSKKKLSPHPDVK
ncbi:flap endonuclease GEN homolog 1-like isoform X2 [Ostrea edulis]|uniref:flap endonuclease GEN homolog 1-like isoform X2 n=2 Tax=Ostrea edulis TaxID=37623 RepID=UPI0024AF08D5|nr:flap endonuclease GEN homolog 1-like isoform X2 [Ostrea edulis]